MIFSLRTPLLNQSNYKTEVEKAVSEAKSEIIIISAFIKIGGLNWIRKFIKKDVKVKILCRWSELDLLQKSSDLEIYNFCKLNNWEFSVIHNLHAKVICIDNKTLFLGSNNLTNRGMCLFGNSNEEVGIKTEIQQNELSVINNLISKSKLINDEIYNLYLNWLILNKDKFKIINFDNEIKKIINIDLDNLWVKDFPSSNFNFLRDNFKSDLEVIQQTKEALNIVDEEFDIKKLEFCLIKSKIFFWIKNAMKLQKKDYFFFGELSHLIHNELKDDPTPYRKTIKDFQSNLYSFFDEMKSDYFVVDVPFSRSKRLTIYDK